jgi:hypothetical protein
MFLFTTYQTQFRSVTKGKNMKRTSIFAAILNMIVISARCYADEGSTACTRDNLIGTWRLVTAEDFVSGQWVPTFGVNPRGYFSFGSDGSASVQFMKFPIGNSTNANSSGNYLAYFGKYTVDEVNCTFTVTVEGSLNPTLVGSDQRRSFEFDNGELHIGDGVSFRRTFVKNTGSEIASERELSRTKAGELGGHERLVDTIARAKQVVGSGAAQDWGRGYTLSLAEQEAISDARNQCKSEVQKIGDWNAKVGCIEGECHAEANAHFYCIESQ